MNYLIFHPFSTKLKIVDIPEGGIDNKRSVKINQIF